jgi:hypothetical protein
VNTVFAEYHGGPSITPEIVHAATYQSHYAYTNDELGVAIDPVDPTTGRLTCLAAYANDPLTAHEPNAQFVNRRTKVYFKAISTIQAHEEIFVNYGEDYWQDPSQPQELQDMAKDYYAREGASPFLPRLGIG